MQPDIELTAWNIWNITSEFKLACWHFQEKISSCRVIFFLNLELKKKKFDIISNRKVRILQGISIYSCLPIIYDKFNLLVLPYSPSLHIYTHTYIYIYVSIHTHTHTFFPKTFENKLKISYPFPFIHKYFSKYSLISPSAFFSLLDVGILKF